MKLSGIVGPASGTHERKDAGNRRRPEMEKHKTQ